MSATGVYENKTWFSWFYHPRMREMIRYKKLSFSASVSCVNMSKWIIIISVSQSISDLATKKATISIKQRK